MKTVENHCQNRKTLLLYQGLWHVFSNRGLQADKCQFWGSLVSRDRRSDPCGERLSARLFETAILCLQGGRTQTRKRAALCPIKYNGRGCLFSQKNKNHIIVSTRVLVACSPVGTVSFLSKSAGGCMSDKDIVKRSGIIDLLERGDTLLADRGFNTLS